MNFYNRIDRLSQYQHGKIRESILRNDVVNYNYLQRFTKDLQYQKIISEILQKPIYNTLYGCYLNRQPIDEKSKDANLYFQEKDVLIESGVFHSLDEIENWYLPQLKIKDEEKFEELSRKTLKEFSFLILYEKRIHFLKSFLDEISQRGPFNYSEIQSLKDNLDVQSAKIEKYIKQVPSRQPSTKKIKPNKIPFNTFHLDILKKNPGILDQINHSLFGGFTLLKTHKLICPDTSYKNFTLIFKPAELNQDQRIHWVGTMKELKLLIQEICKPNICSQLSKMTLDKWIVASNCFLIKQKGLWVQIESYGKISNSNGTDKNQPVIQEFGRILQDLK